MELNTELVSSEELTGKIARFKGEGHRFVTMTAVETDEETVDILYHFDKGLSLTHLRLSASKGEEIPSISPVFFAAFLVENEICEQFGVRFDGLVLDFGGTLLLEDEVRSTPFCKYGIKREKDNG